MKSKFPKFDSLIESTEENFTKIKRGAISYGKSGAHVDKKQKHEKPFRKQKHKNRERDRWYE